VFPLITVWNGKSVYVSHSGIQQKSQCSIHCATTHTRTHIDLGNSRIRALGWLLSLAEAQLVSWPIRALDSSTVCIIWSMTSPGPLAYLCCHWLVQLNLLTRCKDHSRWHHQLELNQIMVTLTKKRKHPTQYHTHTHILLNTTHTHIRYFLWHKPYP